jgi:uncharacterized protein YndB with AHSA1/START domain
MNAANADVEIRRRLSVSVERVFAAFSDPRLVAQWLRPSPEVMLTVLAFDFRPGGAYRFAYDVPDGRRMIVGGTYSLIERPTQIAFSWLIEPPDEHAGIESEVTVTLVASADATELTIRHAKFGRADANARHADGWRGALEQLDRLLHARSGTEA